MQDSDPLGAFAKLQVEVAAATLRAKAEGIVTMMSKSQKAAILWLSGTGFAVGGLRGMGKKEPSHRAYLGIKHLLEEHWTGFSTTRPDCGLNELGREVQKVLRDGQG